MSETFFIFNPQLAVSLFGNPITPNQKVQRVEELFIKLFFHSSMNKFGRVCSKRIMTFCYANYAKKIRLCFRYRFSKSNNEVLITTSLHSDFTQFRCLLFESRLIKIFYFSGNCHL